jgi:hypothetical protein
LDITARKLLEAGENCTVRRFITCTVYQILLGWSTEVGWDVQNM